MSYKIDRTFTDKAHKLAVVSVYPLLEWTEFNEPDIFNLDINHGIDYVFTDKYNKKITVQERFRRHTSATYDSITIRYKRDNSIKHNLSEFFKIKANYLLYAVLNESETDFISVNILDVSFFLNEYNNDNIIIQDNGKTNSSILSDKIICPIVYNKDGSSSFIAINYKHLITQYQNNCIIFNK